MTLSPVPPPEQPQSGPLETAPPAVTIPPPAPLARGTLSRELVLRTTALVALATLALSFFTLLASFQILQRELDERLESAVGRGIGPRRSDDTDLSGSGLIRISPTSSGVFVLQPDGVTLSESTLNMLIGLPVSAQPVTVNIPEAGLYRVLVRESTDSTIPAVVGLPYADVTKPLANQAIIAGLLTAATIGLAFAAALRVVERSLRPLNRLAVAAAQVSQLPLESGEATLPVRVSAQDADPRNEVGRVGAAFNHMLDHVENALAVRHQSETKVRRFVADASHELRNPLAAIRGYAELTRRSGEQLPEGAAHALNRIEAESGRMSGLVEDLLLLARLDSEPTLDLQPCDITELVINAVSDSRAASPQHRWALELPPDPVMVMGDAARLPQVIVNLLGNARTHTPPGTIVTTSVWAVQGWAEIRVHDNGPGVPEEIRANVFERFTRADASRVRHQGASSTGLGLAIVQAVVSAHSGAVWLDSVPGSTTFTVRLPLLTGFHSPN